jgi:hypothetical protein
VIEFTDWAIEILGRSDAAARRLNPSARVRLVRDDRSGVRFELTDEPAPDDAVVEHEAGFTMYVQRGLDGTVDVVEPHDRLILRSPGDDTRSIRGEH